MNAVILTEGGRKAGFGHIIRCFALAQAMKRLGIKVKLIINADKSAKVILNKEKAKYAVMDWIKDKKKLLSLVGQKGLIVVDSYLAGPDFYYLIHNSKPQTRIVVIDDYNRMDYSADVLINPSIFGNKVKYKRRRNITYLLGKDYIILRKEFWKIPAKRIKRNIKHVLITAGGAEHYGFLSRLLRHLKMVFPDYVYHVVAPSKTDVRAGADIERYSSLSAYKMKEIMLKSDIAVSGCGQTLYELARLGVPTVGIRFSENQRANTEGLYKEGFLGRIFHYKSEGFLNNVASEIKSLQSESVRKGRAKTGRRLIDGRGACRIAEKLTEFNDPGVGIHLRAASMNDCGDILSWRNHKDIRKWCFNDKTICGREHKKWLKDAIRSRDKRIYIAVNDAGESVGQIRINIDNGKRALINVNLNPRFIGMGFGSKMISMGTRLLLKEVPETSKVLAEIISENTASKKAFQKAGYVLSYNDIKQGKHIAVFEYAGTR